MAYVLVQKKECNAQLYRNKSFDISSICIGYRTTGCEKELSAPTITKSQSRFFFLNTDEMLLCFEINSYFGWWWEVLMCLIYVEIWQRDVRFAWIIWVWVWWFRILPRASSWSPWCVDCASSLKSIGKLFIPSIETEWIWMVTGNFGLTTLIDWRIRKHAFHR